MEAAGPLGGSGKDDGIDRMTGWTGQVWDRHKGEEEGKCGDLLISVHGRRWFKAGKRGNEVQAVGGAKRFG